MATGRDIVETALKLVDVVGVGQTASAEDTTDALSALNRMLGLWNAELGLIYAETTESLTLTPAQASYTIGTGGNFNTTRPQKILSAQIRVDSTDYPMNLISHQDYQALERKDLENQHAWLLAYNPTYPLGTILLYPAPASGASLRLTSLKPLSAMTLDAAVSLPDGYEEALIYNLAVRLAHQYKSPISPEVRDFAITAKQSLQAQNDSLDEMTPDYHAPGLARNYQDLRPRSTL